jgi:2'-5' RNA ligase
MVRRQLSLFVPEPWATQLEAMRAILDPVQHRLIPAHVTACRDEETRILHAHALDHTDQITGQGPITLTFGRAVPFDGHGVLLPCIEGEESFSAFRAHLLEIQPARRQVPHITLAHPRNAKSKGNNLAFARKLPEQIRITFQEACLIEQQQGENWRVLRRFQLIATNY